VTIIAKIGVTSNEVTRESFVVFVFAESGISFLLERESDTFALGKTDGGSLAITNNEDVADSGGERVAVHISNVGDVVGTDVSLNGLKNTDSANVVSSGEHDSAAVHELDDAVDLVGREVELYKAR
jgi:hypothetical protein